MVPYHIVASQNEEGLIGIHDTLFCECREDLQRFYEITTDTYPETCGGVNILIMGYKTWASIPEAVRPFKGRLSIVVSRDHVITESDAVVQVTSLQKAFDHCAHHARGRVFVIGGQTIFEQCRDDYPQFCHTIYLTQFRETDHRSTAVRIVPTSCRDPGYRYFPAELFQDAIIQYRGPQRESEGILRYPHHEKHTKLYHQLLVYQKERYLNVGESQYLRLLEKIMSQGQRIQTRNAKVYSVFGERMVFDLEQGFPLLTTKRMGYKTILRELLWFISGSTSNRDLQEKHVHIWDQNASKEFLEGRGLDYEEGDLGPVYGFQWRHAGAEYKGCHETYGGKGYDQLKEVIRLLREDPHSRRILMSAWNPRDLDKMALPPCHVMCQFYVNEDRRLDCQLYQRSGDMFLGVPFNIASYAFLTHLIAKVTGYKPGSLLHILGDAHIYECHLEQVKAQIKRIPVEFPNIHLEDSIREIDDIHEDMVHIEQYRAYPRLNASMVA